MSNNIKVGYTSIELDKNVYRTAKYKLIAVMLFFREVVDLGFNCANIDGDFDTIVIDGISTSNIIEATLLYLKMHSMEVDMVRNTNKETNENIEFWDAGDRYVLTYPYEYGALMDIVMGINCSSDRNFDTVVKIGDSKYFGNRYDSVLHFIANYVNKNLTPVDAYSVEELCIEVMVCEELTFIVSIEGIYVVDFFTVCSKLKNTVGSIIREYNFENKANLKELNTIMLLK